MDIGKLNQLIELGSLGEENQEGQLVQTFTPVETVWGYVLSQHGGETFEAARQNARATIRVKIRYRDDVTTTWRLKWLGQYYNIVYVDPSEHRLGALWLTAENVGGAP